eukprot:6396175-Pyramimonas_sp.AAC.1
MVAGPEEKAAGAMGKSTKDTVSRTSNNSLGETTAPSHGFNRSGGATSRSRLLEPTPRDQCPTG